MQQKWVSVILPTYNRAKLVGRAIESVLNQTYPYFELLVIDDGSTDNTEGVIRQYQDSRVCYYKLQKNVGQSAARNYGMRQAKYEYLAFEDSDDLWHPKKLEIQMRTLLEADECVGFSYHKLKYDLGEGRSITLPDEKVSIEKKSGDIYAQLLWDNLVGMPTLLIKRECLAKSGYLDETMTCLEDYDFALGLAKNYKAVFINEVLLDSGFSNTGVSGNSYQYLVASCQLIQKYKKDYIDTDTLNHRLEIILRDAASLGIQDKILSLLKQVMRS